MNTIGGAALRGNMFSGDELKDSSDSGEGLKCAVTRMGSACNRLGFCDDYFPPRLEEYTLQMVSVLHQWRKREHESIDDTAIGTCLPAYCTPLI